MANVHMPYSDDLEVSGKQGSYAPNEYDEVNVGVKFICYFAFHMFITIESAVFLSSDQTIISFVDLVSIVGFL